MNTLDAIRRLRAWQQGRPVESVETLPFPRAERGDVQIVAFVRMAGETAPWGFAVGAPGEAPTIETIPEPRNLDLVAELAARLAPALLGHLPHPAFVAPALDDAPPADATARQLWLPGPTHVEMLHLLDYRFTRTRTGAADRVGLLNALGRGAGWLFRESTRPSQVRVMDATRRLREVFAFPAEDVRQQHLGFLLAWLGDDGATREARLAASEEAELESVSLTLDPELERRVLEPLLACWHRAGSDEAAGIAREIDAVLRPELERRFRLAEAAYDTLASDPRPSNPRASVLAKDGRDEFAWQYWRGELARVRDDDASSFVPDAETDRSASAAASRYFAHLHGAELLAGELVHGDGARVREALCAGDAFAGRIADVRDVSPTRAVRPVWRVDSTTDHPLRLREGASVCIAGVSGRTGRVLAIETSGPRRTFTVEITGWKTARRAEGLPAADDARVLVGTAITFVAAGAPGLSRRKAQEAWKSDGPGAWLTHGGPVPLAPTAPAARTDLVALVAKLAGEP